MRRSLRGSAGGREELAASAAIVAGAVVVAGGTVAVVGLAGAGLLAGADATGAGLPRAAGGGAPKSGSAALWRSVAQPVSRSRQDAKVARTQGERIRDM